MQVGTKLIGWSKTELTWSSFIGWVSSTWKQHKMGMLWMPATPFLPVLFTYVPLQTTVVTLQYSPTLCFLLGVWGCWSRSSIWKSHKLLHTSSHEQHVCFAFLSCTVQYVHYICGQVSQKEKLYLEQLHHLYLLHLSNMEIRKDKGLSTACLWHLIAVSHFPMKPESCTFCGRLLLFLGDLWSSRCSWRGRASHKREGHTMLPLTEINASIHKGSYPDNLLGGQRRKKLRCLVVESLFQAKTSLVITVKITKTIKRF